MMKRMDFNDCINQNKLFETGISDKSMALELLKMAEHRESFWLKVNDYADEFPSLFLEGHYEIIKELCTAILAFEGWKAINHECLFSYLKNSEEHNDINLNYLLELKDLRNSIDYRGTMVSPTLWNDNTVKIRRLIHELKEQLRTRLTKKYTESK